MTEIPKAIEKENIVEIIDHHNKDSWLESRNDIKVQIELIGAAATLVAKRFKNENIKISRESAILLYNERGNYAKFKRIL